ncbi:MAG: PorT family protein [Rikenellaceae bacterium]|nr:PorT family protein [Rikenellaceae bacterium]MCL2691883.1 PorT family protein [Rikenellaceae bacterium]
MKKILLVVVAALFVSTSAFAQRKTCSFEWGVKAGFNLSNITEQSEAKFLPSFAAGLFGEYVINDFLGVQAELLYALEGYKVDEVEVKGDDKRGYIQLPIFAKLYILEGLSIDIGPRFGYAVSAKMSFDVDAEDFGEFSGSYYDMAEFNKFDAAAVLGASYKFRFGLDVFARYNLGLTKIWDGADSKNQSILVGLGYRF